MTFADTIDSETSDFLHFDIYIKKGKILIIFSGTKQGRVREKRCVVAQGKVCDDDGAPQTRKAVSHEERRRRRRRRNHKQSPPQDDAISRPRKVPARAAPPRLPPKAVDEDLYKIPPELLSSSATAKPKQVGPTPPPPPPYLCIIALHFSIFICGKNNNSNYNNSPTTLKERL